jgi:hypothetical protein
MSHVRVDRRPIVSFTAVLEDSVEAERKMAL